MPRELLRSFSPTQQIGSCHHDQHPDNGSKRLLPADARSSPQAQGISEQGDEEEEQTCADHYSSEQWTTHDCLLRLLLHHLIRPEQERLGDREAERGLQAYLYPPVADIAVSRGDYCLGGTRVDCQDTNCTPSPRLAHRL